MIEIVYTNPTVADNGFWSGKAHEWLTAIGTIFLGIVALYPMLKPPKLEIKINNVDPREPNNEALKHAIKADENTEINRYTHMEIRFFNSNIGGIERDLFIDEIAFGEKCETLIRLTQHEEDKIISYPITIAPRKPYVIRIGYNDFKPPQTANNQYIIGGAYGKVLEQPNPKIWVCCNGKKRTIAFPKETIEDIKKFIKTTQG